MDESLFSLEVIVNYLKLYKNVHSSRCLFPTVAFRLLDYPTIAINLVEKFDADQLKSRLDLKEPFEQIETLPCFTQLLDKHGRYIFSKGKSCLFRSDMEQLRGHLKNTPMYLLILDTFFDTYKLVGTVPVPLTGLIEEICQETIGMNNDPLVPADKLCMKMSHGLLDVKNLMGDEIGHISVVCRLTSFGKTILPHIVNGKNLTESRKMMVKKDDEKRKAEFLTTTKETDVDEKQPVVYEVVKKKPKEDEKSTRTNEAKKNALLQTIPIDYTDAHVQISDYLNSSKVDKSTQSPKAKKSSRQTQPPQTDVDSSKILLVKHLPGENFFTQYCPPPLHFNSDLTTGNRADSSTNPQQLVNQVYERQTFLNDRIEYLNEALEYEEFLEVAGEEAPDPQQPDEIIIKTKEAKKSALCLDQMPLLKCLLEEMTKLQGLIGNQPLGEPATSAQTSFKVTKVKSARRVVTVGGGGGGGGGPTRLSNQKKSAIKLGKSLSRERINETVNRLSQPKKILKPIKEEESQIGEESSSVSAKKPANKKQPLKYGLTNTFKMRVLANKQSKVKEIETSHESLLREVKNNLDDLNMSSAVAASNDHLTELIQRNLEKLLFDSTGGASGNKSSTSINELRNTLEQMALNSRNMNNTNKSSSNLTLLNRVDMESTFDTMNYQNQLNQPQQQPFNGTSSTKMVQFGDTVVYEAASPAQHSDESSSGMQHQQRQQQSAKSRSKTDRSETTTTTTTDDDNTEDGHRSKNIFLEKRATSGSNPNYEDDFYSSFESSSVTSSTTRQSSSSKKSPRLDRSKRSAEFFDLVDNLPNNYSSYNSQSFTQDTTSSNNN
jgi:hypothetical protein